ncbi:MAG: hypothetical protein OEX03_08185 [Gammaproteobacteria bacterium]|nr:hypothetical protein [Gammaproteobacteria bacterium]
MSLHKYDRPLRIELSPSIFYLRLVRYSHLLSVLFVLYLSSLQWWSLLILLPLLYSYRHALNSFDHNSRCTVLRIHPDGRYISYSADGSQQSVSQIEQVIYLPYLLNIRFERLGKSGHHLLFADAMTLSHWQQLQLFLRFSLQLTADN